MAKAKTSAPIRQGLATVGILLLLILFALCGSAGAGAEAFPWIILGVTLTQVAGWGISVTLRTEKLFDLIGAVTWAGAALAAMWSRPDGLDFYGFLLGVVVLMWALRLGAFLGLRGLRDGDDRFDAIKADPLRFLNVWLLQAVWVTVTGGAVFAAILVDYRSGVALTLALVGCAVAVFGLAFEAVADWQKTAFKRNPRNQGEFITTGLWSVSQHPNYFDEIVVWCGLALAAAPVLGGWQFVLLLSPVFITLLLTKVSGIPTLDKKAEQRWGKRADWRHYRRNTPVLVPRLSSK